MKANAAAYANPIGRVVKKTDRKKSKAAMNATAGGKGRRTGWELYDSLLLNRTPVAAKARKVEAATKAKPRAPKMPKHLAAYPSGTVKNVSKNASRARRGM